MSKNEAKTRSQWASEWNFWIEINSYRGPNTQKLLFHSLQSAFLGVLFLVVSCVIPMTESCSFSALTLFLRFLFFPPVRQVFFPSRTQKPKSSLLDLFQLYAKNQAPCLKQLLQGDHLVSPGLVRSCSHHLSAHHCYCASFCLVLKNCQQNFIKTGENFLKHFKKLLLTLPFNTSILIFSVQVSLWDIHLIH